MKETTAESLSFGPFQKIGKGWMLVSAGTPSKCSAMTASWGGLGVMWGKNVAAIVIRPQRHTLQFLETEGRYTLSFFDEKYRAALNYCGSHSGGENQKIAAAGLTLLPQQPLPVYREASLTLVCKKLYRQPMDPKGLLDPALDTRWYPGKDYHILFVGEIEKVLQP
ncbi:MAG: flavin reductase [Oscillospiraceae bacterium]|jgi:flavin reductase (DIM6/NTAB) family NADH-FMN oxidoreductase RutF|nr:flavin reductase [Oscillospiraceae bacterium]